MLKHLSSASKDFEDVESGPERFTKNSQVEMRIQKGHFIGTELRFPSYVEAADIKVLTRARILVSS